MTQLEPGVATGLFSLGGVVLGALLMPLTQLYLERKREQRAADRAKLLVAGELLHAQLIFRSTSQGEYWPLVEEVNALLPTSAWSEHRSSLVGNVDEDLWNQLVMAYARLETDRTRFGLMGRSATAPLTVRTEEAESLKQIGVDLGRIRRKLGGSGVWVDEIEGSKQKIDGLSKSFKEWLAGFSDGDLQKDRKSVV
jgi:hypothetical protein